MLGITDLAVPSALGVDVQTTSFKGRKGGVRGQVKITTTSDGKIVSVSSSKGLRLPRNVLTGPQAQQTLSGCIDANKCADKPTSAGVALCVANCVLKVLEEAGVEFMTS